MINFIIGYTGIIIALYIFFVGGTKIIVTGKPDALTEFFVEHVWVYVLIIIIKIIYDYS